jgi:crotonobetaine/carnitine-CoA ligase
VSYAQNVTPQQFEAWHERFKAPLLQIWGMTETMSLPLMQPLDLPPRPGYFKNAEATAQTLRDGWLWSSGDHAWMDADGYFFFVDRKKDVIKRAGENVSASEVEEALKQHPAVFDASVAGMPDPVRDEVGKIQKHLFGTVGPA